MRHVFYYAAGGVENLLGEFDQERFDAAAAETWHILNEIEPFLWREGQTYPTSIAALQQLYANQEVGIDLQLRACQCRREYRERDVSANHPGLRDG